MSFPAVEPPGLYETYDYIIIGGGSAGCVLANRLSKPQAPKSRTPSVLLLERGTTSDSFKSRIPLLSVHWASDASILRTWTTVPQEYVNNREFALLGGNVFGGTSKVNGTLYMRGYPGEWDSWCQGKGWEGWRYENMERYLVKSEKNLDENLVGKQYHGSDGEWPNRSLPTLWSERTAHIVKASSALGLPYVEDLNSPTRPAHGFSKLRFNVDAAGNRATVSSCFLPPGLVKDRKEYLHVSLQAAVHRIEIKGDRAEGVWVQKADGTGPTRLIKARREVILCGGAISSPQILMLSGIGPEEHLKHHGIPVQKSLPGVGCQLQDHLFVPIEYQVPIRESYLRLQSGLWSFIKEVILYILWGIGLLVNASTMDGVFFVQTRLLDADAGYRVSGYRKEDMDAALPENLPDLEILPAGAGGKAPKGAGSLSVCAVSLRPHSKGTVQLASSDPFAPCIVDPKYLSDERDLVFFRKGIKFVLALKHQLHLQGYPVTDLHVPKGTSDAELDAFLRAECATGYHYTSTCRMAPEHDGGVVDERLRVYGVKGLRVSDASVIPVSPSTHTAAVTMAVAEKCADMVLEDAKGV
ncbi:hypothetical protein V5O48_017090 [Marasmius crinis-equi]|uniref:Glucose-methanol-choline oxidoreductase N-terminal domain-containing protein n=1 Tax=Marasmius crinis-equi TaxID=585013 RepID=A0ABR3EQ58_9AGAR